MAIDVSPALTSSTRLTRGAWIAVGLLWVVACLNYLDRVMLTTMRESIVSSIHMTEAQFGLLTSVFLWVYGILSPVAGFLADRFNRAHVIIGSLIAWSGVTWLTGHATTFEQLLAARALMGVSEACYIPAALSLIADYHRGPTRSLATGIHMTGVMTGSALGGLGGWIAEQHSWSTAFTWFGVGGVVYAFVLIALLRDCDRDTSAVEGKAPEGGVSFGAALKSLFSRSGFWFLLAYWGLLGIVGWAISGWLPTYLAEKFHLSQGAAGMHATGWVQGAALVGVLLGGVVADRLSRRSERYRILVPAVGMCIGGLALFGAVSTTTLAICLAGFVAYGLTRSTADANMMPILCLLSDSRYRATGYGILNLLACFVGGAAIFVGGKLRDAHINLDVFFQGCAVSMLICFGFLMLVYRKVRE